MSNYQTFLNNILLHAAESENSETEIQLVVTHYVQGIIATFEAFHPCEACEQVNLGPIKANVASLRDGSYTTIPEMLKASAKQIKGIGQLCPTCRQDIKEEILHQFFLIHTHNNTSALL
jgi:hypothetical protein